MPTITLKRRAHEQAPELARRHFGLPLGADEESAEVMRYFFERELGHPGGVLPETLTEIDLPSVPELFKLYRDRALGDRPTGRWTKQRRRQPSSAPKRRL
jgi:hypothetical protein